ncbi:hypothetical protein SUGI_0887390 [Cryptomeria japonica]|uniref:protein DMP3 n=1 Tax=Cryptomeria japonica TaxID=3369 RepID=UPI0024146938|nr:protein DMP3 [Cryptomeria japonica]XP_057858859.1 protein DMP3 [Cryptomeria japonica]GLJ42795.1 hypothetical protein SUGI_0887390 [Cryptomeria japonica]
MEENSESTAVEEGHTRTDSLSIQTPAEKVPSTLSTLSNLSKILPTGILFVFQALSNFIASDNTCGNWNKILVVSFLGILAIASFLMTFTDSFKDDSTGQVHYGIATRSGLVIIGSRKNKIKPPMENDYKLEFMDLVHSSLSMLVFGVLALTDKNVVNCLYPSAEDRINKLLQALPLIVSSVSCAVFTLFPSKRHGISHPVAQK